MLNTYEVQEPGGGQTVGTATCTDAGGGTWRINTLAVQVAWRQQEFGTALLHSIMADANSEEVVLLANVGSPDTSEDPHMSARSLCKWFGRNGFLSQDDEGGLYEMSRQPGYGDVV